MQIIFGQYFHCIYKTKASTRIAKKYAGAAEYESISIYIYGVRKINLMSTIFMQFYCNFSSVYGMSSAIWLYQTGIIGGNFQNGD